MPGMLNHNPEAICVRRMLKWLQKEQFQSIHQRSIDAVTSIFALFLIGLCVWADAWSVCFLPFLGSFPTWQHRLFKVRDYADAASLRTWGSWCFIFSLYLAACVILTYGHVPWWAAGGWPLSVWAWSPPPVQSNGDGESHTKSEY